MDQREVVSFCRFCVAGCGIRVTVEGETVTRVRGDARHPLSRGYTCAKGRALPGFHHDPRRLDEPAIGVGSNRRIVSWPEFTADAARRLERTIAQYGPDAVGVFAGSGTADASGSVLVRALCSEARAISSLRSPSTGRRSRWSEH